LIRAYCGAAVFSESSITVFYLICGALLLWNVIRGWRAGPARMAVAFGAVAAGYLAALLAGDIFVAPLRTVLGYPDFVLLAIGRAIAGIEGYFLILGIGAILFKRTSQQGVGLLRLLYGLSGAVLGMLFGVCVVAVLTISVRLVGTLAEGRLAVGESPLAGETSGASGAFATQVLGCLAAWNDEKFCREILGLDGPAGQIDRAKLNVDGGAISLGHPVGTSGNRIVLHLINAMKRLGTRRGIATECIGGGQGGAMLIETV
jgi:hypothetical protein